MHVSHGVPEDIPEVSLGDAVGAGGNGEVHLPALIAGIFEISSSEARRLITQGGVKLDGEGIDADRLDLPLEQLSGRVLQVGKRRFARLRSLNWTAISGYTSRSLLRRFSEGATS